MKMSAISLEYIDSQIEIFCSEDKKPNFESLEANMLIGYKNEVNLNKIRFNLLKICEKYHKSLKIINIAKDFILWNGKQFTPNFTKQMDKLYESQIDEDNIKHKKQVAFEREDDKLDIDITRQ